MFYVISKKMDGNDLINILEMGAEKFYYLVREEIRDRMEKKESSLPKKRRGRPPKIEKTGEFIRTKDAPRRLGRPPGSKNKKKKTKK